MSGNWERRWHPLLQQWVMISAKSALRPWSVATQSTSDQPAPVHDPDCYLCPRVARATGNDNPDYRGVMAFNNDFPSLSDEAPEPAENDSSGLQRRARSSGVCRVLCWSERHNATLAELSAVEMRAVVELWKNEYQNLSQQDGIEQVMIFENKGTEVGVSNLHPHGQIYATGFVTDTALRLRDAQQKYAQAHNGQDLLPSLIHRPEYDNDLLVEAGKYFKTIVPFAARFSFETWIVPRQRVGSISELTAVQLDELAQMYQRQAQRYDRLFNRKSPNITLLQNAPSDNNPTNQHWCFHIIQQPPLRDAATLKYLGGWEMGSNVIVNPVQPEMAAQRLRECD